jgi:hypothetical protein
MDNKKTLIVIFLIFVAYQLSKKFLGTGLTPSGSQDIKPGTDLTYSANDYELFADSIETAFWGNLGGFYEDDELAFNVLEKMRTNDDLYKLAQVYGTRGRGIIIQDGYNLIQTVERLLDNEYKNQLNELYSQRGIKYQFSEN